ncbi:MAG: glycosyltransferase family 1 protein [Acidimicrobiales bacterium]
MDATQVGPSGPRSGIARYVDGVLGARAVQEDLDVRALARSDAELAPGITRVEVRRRLSSGRPHLWEHQLRRAWEVRRAHPAVFHNPNPHAPVRPGVPWVQTLHDVIPLVFDDPTLAGLRTQMARYGPRYAEADAVIAVSQHAADEGVRLLDIDPARLHVIPHGVHPSFRADGPSEPADPPYFAVVSEFSLRKGFGQAFAAVAQLADTGLPHRLRVAGRVPPWSAAQLDALLAAAARPDRISMEGFTPDLPAFLRGATATLVTSRYEGFGFTALESMACGTPVVAFANTSLPEVVGDGGVLVPDGDVEAMVDAAEAIATDPAHRSRLVAAGLARAAAFSWEESGARHAAVYRQVAGR